jgi:hypothetical protein
MCGVLLVHSRNTIPLEQHLPAINILKTRGPNFTRYRHHNNIFVAQTMTVMSFWKLKYHVTVIVTKIGKTLCLLGSAVGVCNTPAVETVSNCYIAGGSMQNDRI